MNIMIMFCLLLLFGVVCGTIIGMVYQKYIEMNRERMTNIERKWDVVVGCLSEWLYG